jgi:hypothetical protein
VDRPGVEDPVPRCGRRHGVAGGIGCGDRGQQLSAYPVEVVDGPGHALVIAHGEAVGERGVRRCIDRLLGDLGPQPLQRSSHDVGRMLDDAPDRQCAPARRLARLLLGEAERGGTDGGELFVEVVDQTGDLVVLGGCVHRARPPGSDGGGTGTTLPT